MEEKLKNRLQKMGLSVCTAESITGGGIARRLTALPGVSAVFRGGVCVYQNESKTKVLGISPELLQQHGAVSAETAQAMAQNAAALFDADVAIASTGNAGPGALEQKPVGTVFLSVYSRWCHKTIEYHFCAEGEKSREEIRKQSEDQTFLLALSVLKQKENA